MTDLITPDYSFESKKKRLFLIELTTGFVALLGTAMLYVCMNNSKEYNYSFGFLVIITIITLALGIATLIMGITGSQAYKEKKYFLFGIFVFLLMLPIILIYLGVMMIGIGFALSGAKNL